MIGIVLRLSGFILCAFLLSLPSQTEAQPAGCVWTPYQNTLIYGGYDVGSYTTTLAACQAACPTFSGCTGVDWAPNNPGTKCYLTLTPGAKVPNQIGVTHYDLVCPNSGCTWVKTANTLIYGGAVNGATSVAACQATCITATLCISIDWSNNNPAGQQCFLSNTQSGKSPGTGVDHYDLGSCSGGGGGIGSSATSLPGGVTVQTTRPSLPTLPSGPPGSTVPCVTAVKFAVNTSSIYALYVPEITNLFDCFTACNFLFDCVGYDLSGSIYSLCWLYFNGTAFQQKYAQPGVLEYTMVRCVDQDVGYCSPNYDMNGVLNDTCSSFCHTSFSRLDNFAGTGSNPWIPTNQSSFRDCLENCTENWLCLGVELRNQPGVQSACKYYTLDQAYALQAGTPTPFVTQYSVANSCATSCAVTWDRFGQMRIRILHPMRISNVTSEADCLKACHLSTTCLVAEFRSVVNAGCLLTDAYVPNTWTSDGATVTFIYREICQPSTVLSPTPVPVNNPGAGFPGVSVVSSFPGSSAAVNPSFCWLGTKNTNAPQGVLQPSATTLALCQSQCYAAASCSDNIDWDNNAAPGNQCFFHTTISVARYASNGVDHYDYIC